MDTRKSPEPIPPMRRGTNAYKPEDIRRWGVERFLDEVAPRKPFEMRDLGFTEEENQRMDEILREERQAVANGL